MTKMTPSRWRSLETYLLSERDLAPTTAHKTIRFLRILERHGIDPRKPSRKAYNAFLASRKREGKAGPGLRHYTRALRHALAWSGRFWPDLRLPRCPTSRRSLIPDVCVARLLDYREGRDELETLVARFAFRLGFYACLRAPSEHFALELDDFDPAARTLRIWSDKLDRYDVLDLEPWFAEEICAFINGPRAAIAKHGVKSLLVEPATGRPFASAAAYAMWLRRCGLRVYDRFAPGLLRHTGLTWYFLQTGDIDLTKARARHRQLSSTEHYVILAKELQRRRAAAANVQPYVPGTLA